MKNELDEILIQTSEVLTNSKQVVLEKIQEVEIFINTCDNIEVVRNGLEISVHCTKTIFGGF